MAVGNDACRGQPGAAKCKSVSSFLPPSRPCLWRLPRAFGPGRLPVGPLPPRREGLFVGPNGPFSIAVRAVYIAVAARLWRRNMAFLPFWGLRRPHRGAYGIAIPCLWRPNTVCPSALRISAENGSFAGRCRRGAAHAVLGGMVVIKFLHRLATGRCRCRVSCCPARRGARAPPMVKNRIARGGMWIFCINFAALTKCSRPIEDWSCRSFLPAVSLI